ncbi:hypothetical protein BKA58DRAFT_380051 [Alternaria rosae]|uniref:uncharacterized protein n=1 Tax=Alternaria rosae TaxID=1187941 RepID=UPI001E8EEF49|nr:uncharacterized protein BKA58DRAFT_380051 [Alternaria rosae]KAH6875567.1 hypothetical protein BKA58DRAFT_380051 [Alternaria rosae]
MSNADSSTELVLQICFGIFGVFSTVATLAGLHHHVSLGCVLVRRLRGRSIPHAHDLEVEAANTSLEDLDVIADYSTPPVRRPTLPPSYKQSGESSHFGSFLNADIDVVPSKSEPNISQH